MKKRPINRSKPNALDALLSVAIIAASNPTVQQTAPVLALLLGYAVGVAA